jgi:hypothetical protein
LTGGNNGRKEYNRRRPARDLPRNLNIHELEENREFRSSAYYVDKYGYHESEDDRRDQRDKRDCRG